MQTSVVDDDAEAVNLRDDDNERGDANTDVRPHDGDAGAPPPPFPSHPPVIRPESKSKRKTYPFGNFDQYFGTNNLQKRTNPGLDDPRVRLLRPECTLITITITVVYI